jgi:predicted Zn-dependent protease
MRYWEKNGYHFDAIIPDTSPACMNPRFGEIIITLPESGFSDTHLASTRLYVSNKTGEIVKAKIHILPKYARKERVLEHEFGHALGWEHYSERYHIMHPLWAHGGYTSTGVRKR